MTSKRLAKFSVHQFFALYQHFDIWPAKVTVAFRDKTQLLLIIM